MPQYVWNMMTDRILEIGNLVPPRENFDNPQEGRVYGGGGIAPTIRTKADSYWTIMYEDGRSDKDL